MLNVRSRTGVVALTSGAAVLLALPVVASGQVPGVDQVVRDVTQAAGTVTQAPAPPAPLPAPAPAPAPAPQAAPAPAPAAPRSPSPATPRTTAAPSSAQGSDGPTRTPAHGSARASGASDSGGVRAHSSQQSGAPEDQGDAAPARASSSERAGGADAGAGGVDDPGPGSLPFTGLELSLIGLVGCAALLGGAALRRGLRPSRA